MTSYHDGAVSGEREPCDTCTSGADVVTKMSVTLQVGQQALNTAKQDVAVAMGYQPVDMSMVPDHIKEFCANGGFFLLEAQSKRVHSHAVMHHVVRLAFGENDIAAVRNTPSNHGIPAHVAHTAELATTNPATTAPLGKLNDVLFSSFNETTPLSTFTVPASSVSLGRFDNSSFTSLNECTPLSSFTVAPAPNSNVSGEQNLVDAMPSPLGSIANSAMPSPLGSITDNADVNLPAYTELQTSTDVPPELRWYVVYIGRQPGVFQGLDVVTNNTSGISGKSFQHCKSELHGCALLKQAVSDKKVARVTFILDKTYLTAADFTV
ncbi:hypothetical protein DXG01_009454 [Tephrocybe rancida]|nr:hypothetical protein DXG01_009454 [Tephrocybe rancida]